MVLSHLISRIYTLKAIVNCSPFSLYASTTECHFCTHDRRNTTYSLYLYLYQQPGMHKASLIRLTITAQHNHVL